ncbi:MAG TPA: hypothetical protein VIH59_18845 [Candidatus Tectomicrobia bacterium]
MERQERHAQLAPHINGLRQCRVALGEVLQGHKRPLKMCHRCPVGGAHHGPGAGLTQVYHCFLLHLALPRMVGEPFGLFSQAVGIEPLKGVHNMGVEGAPALLQEAKGLPAAVSTMVCSHRLASGVKASTARTTARLS